MTDRQSTKAKIRALTFGGNSEFLFVGLADAVYDQLAGEAKYSLFRRHVVYGHSIVDELAACYENRD